MFTQTQTRPQSAQFVNITMKGGVLRASIVAPSIDERASQIISREINDAIQRAGRRLKALVLDMAQVRRMSSIGLGMCIDARNTAHAGGALAYTVSLSRELTDLFRMMRVDRLFTMVFDDDELTKLLRSDLR